jgi:hypothetical protein
MDYNIALPQFNVAPVQNTGPLNMLTDVMKLKGLQREEQLNQLKMQEYVRARADAATARAQAAVDLAEKNANKQALMNAMRAASVGANGPQTPDMSAAANALIGQGRLPAALTALGASEAFTKDRKAKSDLAKIDTENVDKNLSTFRTFASGVNSPESAAIYAKAMYDHPVLGPLMQQTGYDKDSAAAKAAQDYASNPQQWMASHVGLTGEQVMKTLQQPQRSAAATPAETPMPNPVTSAAFNAPGASPVQLAMLGGGAGAGVSPLLQMTRPMPSEGGVTAPNQGSAPAPTPVASRKPAAADSGLPPGLKLKAGEVWNSELERADAVKGSDLYIAQSQKHQKDARAVEGVASKMDDAVANINDMLSDKNKEGFDNNFGGYTAYATNKFTGNTAKVKSMLEKFNSNMKAAGLELFRTGGSIGAMTEKEWPIVQNEMAALSPTMNVDDARDAMTKIASRLQRIRDNAHEIYSDTWGQTQFFKKPKGNEVDSNNPLLK